MILSHQLTQPDSVAQHSAIKPRVMILGPRSTLPHSLHKNTDIGPIIGIRARGVPSPYLPIKLCKSLLAPVVHSKSGRADNRGTRSCN